MGIRIVNMLVVGVITVLLASCASSHKPKESKVLQVAMLEVYDGNVPYKVNSIQAIHGIGICLSNFIAKNKVSPIRVQIAHKDDDADTGNTIRNEFHIFNKKNTSNPIAIDAENFFDDVYLAQNTVHYPKSAMYLEKPKRFVIRSPFVSNTIDGTIINSKLIDLSKSKSSNFQRIQIDQRELKFLPPFHQLSSVSTSFGVGFFTNKDFINVSSTLADVNVNFYSGENISETVTISTLAKILVSMLTVDRAVEADCISQVITKDKITPATFPLEDEPFRGGVCIKEHLVNRDFAVNLKVIPSNLALGTDMVLGHSTCGVRPEFSPQSITIAFKESQQCISLGYSTKQMRQVENTFSEMFKKPVTHYRVSAFTKQGFSLGCMHYDKSKILGFN